MLMVVCRRLGLTSSNGSGSSPRSSSSFQFWKSTLSQCCLVFSLRSLSHQTAFTFSSLNSTTRARTAKREACLACKMWRAYNNMVGRWYVVTLVLISWRSLRSSWYFWPSAWQVNSSLSSRTLMSGSWQSITSTVRNTWCCLWYQQQWGVLNVSSPDFKSKSPIHHLGLDKYGHSDPSGGVPVIAWY